MVAVALQRSGRNVCEQISRQTELVNTLQLVDFLLHTLQTEGTDILFERVQGRLRTRWHWFQRDFCCPCLSRICMAVVE